MSNEIKITMGGYLDENDKLMDRTELNKRINGLKQGTVLLGIEYEELKTEMAFMKKYALERWVSDELWDEMIKQLRRR